MKLSWTPSQSRPVPNAATNRAFTRTELIVVIGVLLLIALIALMFPVLRRGKELTRRSQCENNEKLIGLALVQYFQDHHDKFPREWNNNPTAAICSPDPSSPTGYYCNKGFDAILQPYLKNRTVFVCPSDSMLKSNIVAGYASRNRWDDTSYGMNILVQGKPLEMFSDLAHTILFAQTRFEHTIWNDQHSAIFDAHLHGNNYIFSDGHVQWLEKTATYNPKNLWTPQRVEP